MPRFYAQSNRNILTVQIEKFIEAIYPSQNAEEAKRKVKGEQTEAERKKAEEDAEARQDVFFMMMLMGVILVVVSLLMVCLVFALQRNPTDFSQIGTAWFLGARFDLAWQELRSGNFRPPTKREL